jgi:hypothetical protein
MAYGRENTWAKNDSVPILNLRVDTKSSQSPMSGGVLPQPRPGYRGGRRKSYGVLAWKGERILCGSAYSNLWWS